MVTRTVTQVRREVLVYDKELDSQQTIDWMAKETDSKWDKKLLATYPTFILLKVLSEEKVTYKLEMDDAMFFELATKTEISEKESEDK